MKLAATLIALAIVAAICGATPTRATVDTGCPLTGTTARRMAARRRPSGRPGHPRKTHHE